MSRRTVPIRQSYGELKQNLKVGDMKSPDPPLTIFLGGQKPPCSSSELCPGSFRFATAIEPCP